MKWMKRLLRQTELHVLFFALGFVSLNWPILSIFHGKNPADIFTYFFVIWALVIVMLALISWACGTSVSEGAGDVTE